MGVEEITRVLEHEVPGSIEEAMASNPLIVWLRARGKVGEGWGENDDLTVIYATSREGMSNQLVYRELPYAWGYVKASFFVPDAQLDSLCLSYWSYLDKELGELGLALQKSLNQLIFCGSDCHPGLKDAVDDGVLYPCFLGNSRAKIPALRAYTDMTGGPVTLAIVLTAMSHASFGNDSPDFGMMSACVYRSFVEGLGDTGRPPSMGVQGKDYYEVDALRSRGFDPVVVGGACLVGYGAVPAGELYLLNSDYVDLVCKPHVVSPPVDAYRDGVKGVQWDIVKCVCLRVKAPRLCAKLRRDFFYVRH